MSAFGIIGYNLKSLLTFQGRDSRTTFWTYLGALAVAYFAVSMAFGSIMGGVMMLDLVRGAARHGDASEAVMLATIKTRMIWMMRGSLWLGVVLMLVMTVLLAASFTRRLHDSGKPGWITALVATLQLVAVAGTIGSMETVTAALEVIDFQHPEAFQEQVQAQRFTLQSLISWVPLLMVASFGAFPSNDGDNRYGPEPDDD